MPFIKASDAASAAALATAKAAGSSALAATTAASTALATLTEAANKQETLKAVTLFAVGLTAKAKAEGVILDPDTKGRTAMGWKRAAADRSTRIRAAARWVLVLGASAEESPLTRAETAGKAVVNGRKIDLSRAVADLAQLLARAGIDAAQVQNCEGVSRNGWLEAYWMGQRALAALAALGTDSEDSDDSEVPVHESQAAAV
jgi:hypothetical protein